MKNQPQNATQALEQSAKVIQKLVTKYTRNHFHLRDDIRQEAIIGVLKAWEKYEAAPQEQRKASFSTYAYYWAWDAVKAYTLRQWKDIELTREYMEDRDDTQSYDMEQELKDHDLAKQADAIGGEFRAIFDARMAGYTFKEVAEEMGYKNQFTCRNIYMDGVAQLDAE